MKLTKHPITGLIALSLALLFTTGSAMAAVVGSKHDLSLATSPGNSVSGTSSDNGQVCVFCHTPHSSGLSTANQVIPLWNRTTTSTAAFTPYANTQTGTLSGEVLTLGSGGVGGVSLACLSCHDGTISIDSVLNVPGSGNTWGTTTITDTATMTATGELEGVVLMGTDLTDDHPIAVEFGGGGCNIGEGGFASGDPCTSTEMDDKKIVSAYADGSGQYWVDTDAGSSYSAADKIPLFARDFAAGTGTGPSIECASCHDVHNNSGFDMLLREDTAASAICTACHIK